MSDMTQLAQLLRDGRIAEARAATAARVRADPADAAARLDLVDMLILLGEWEKADTHADLAASLDAQRAVAIAQTRQLLRAAAWRDDCFAKARPPELVTEPDAGIRAALARIAGSAPDQAGGAAHDGDHAVLHGIVDGAPFDMLRDADDRTAQVLEVFTATGKYVWVPLAAIVSLQPARPGRVRDLVWRPAELEVAGGPSGVVYLPATYVAASPTDAQRLARETDWLPLPDGGTAGVGARLWLVGDDALGLDDFAELRVTQR